MYTKTENILTVNCGSSSIKVSLFSCEKGKYGRLLDIRLKGLRSEKCKLEVIFPDSKTDIPAPKNPGIREGMQSIFEVLTKQFGFAFATLQGIGHRFVHGGGRYYTPTLIDATIIDELEKLTDLAPLHNDACLEGIKACLALAPSIPQAVLFDTAFYHNLPGVSSQYALDGDLAAKYGIRRYGFHGIANSFLWNAYAENSGNEAKDKKIITMHLGNGCSVTAIKGGFPVDTSMGFTPAEGLIMATRAGDIDAAVVEYLCLHAHMTPNEVTDLLNFKSGLLGISGTSSAMETLLDRCEDDKKAALAVDMFCYRIVKYLGAYIAVMGGVDALIFSGGIGENSPVIRQKILSKMILFGIEIDPEANNKAVNLPLGSLQEIQGRSSQVSCYVIACDENLFIAKETNELLD